MTAAPSPLPVGSVAPELALRDQHGATIGLSGLRGSTVLLVFFPFAFSGVCSGELKELDRRWPEVAAPDRVLLAVSCDPVYALRAWADRDGLTTTLLSDFWPHGATAAAYGVLDAANGAPHRSSFVVDPGGRIAWSLHVERHEHRDVEVHAQAVRAASAKNR